MADENNPVHKINQPITPQIQSSSQSQTFQSSQFEETLLNNTVRNLIHQFNASGAHPPEELDQFEQAINESRRILTRAYSNLTGIQPTEIPLPQIRRPHTHHTESAPEEQEQHLGVFPDHQFQQPSTCTNQPSSSLGPPATGGSG